MRVTHQILKNTVINNVQRNLRNLDYYQHMLSSGKNVRKPSDDPIKVARVLSYNTALDQNGQYQKNIQAARTWIDTTEDALHGITEALQRANELAVAGANGALSDNERNAIAQEIDELVNVLVQLGNSSYENRYIFGGFQTTTVPFSRTADLGTWPTGIQYNGDQGVLSWEVAPGVTIRGNITGDDLFFGAEPGKPGMLETMTAFADRLRAGDSASISASIGDIKTSLERTLDKRAAMGATRNGLDLTLDNFQSQKINFTRLRSELEDIDFPETMMNFSVMDTLYRASLSAGARIMQPSLMDFLR